MNFELLGEYWHQWLSNKWLTWGVGPALAASLGYYIPALILEILIRLPWLQSSLIRYAPNAPTRLESVKQTQQIVSFSRQIWIATTILLGPTAIANVIIGPLINKFIFPEITSDFPSWQEFLLSFIVMQLVGDFALYWGHRIQHTNKYLWKHYHSVHHTILTPTPVSTIYIDGVDATLQAGLPMLVAGVAGRAHPFTFYVYVFFRIAENVLNHSGLDSTLINILSLKILPGRAAIAHHDSHHRFSKGGSNAKNYAENFWIWDWLFGTLRNPGNV